MRKKFLLFLSLLAATTVSAQLSGTYTISGDASQNPDFVSFSEAASALAAGVSGQVVFEVAPGTYEEYVTLNSINGTNATNRVVFRGMGADSQQVVVTSNAGYTNNSTLTLDGPDYVTFENMTLASTSENTAIVVTLRGGLSNDRFENVRFVGCVSDASNTDNNKNLVYRLSGGWMDTDNAFVGCEFVNGFIGLYYQGSDMTQYNDGLLVENCSFTNQCSKSIYATFTDHVTLSGNTIDNTNDSHTDYNAIDVFRCRYNCLIENNVMTVNHPTKYVTVMKIRPCTGSVTEPIIIRNNIVNLQTGTSSNWCYAFDNADCDYIYFAHNTAKISGTGSGGNLFVQKDWEHFYAYNNLLVNETDGVVFRFNNASANRFCDYNRVSYAGGNVGNYSGENYAGLEAWSANTGFDAHSDICLPEFVGENDLHITDANGLTVENPLDYVTTDIDGEDRSETPCAGADEYGSVVNLPPVVANPIADIVFEVFPASQTIDLTNTFDDPDDPNENIIISVVSNDNPSLVEVALDNRSLLVERLLGEGGTALITLEAESNGQTVQTSFSVECVAEDLPPVVVNPLAPIEFDDFPQSFSFDISNCFDDPDNDPDMMEYSLVTIPSEVSASIGENGMLIVTRITPDAFANRFLMVRATSNGKHVDMEVSVSGSAPVVDLPPYVQTPVHDVEMTEFPKLVYIDLNGVVTDDDDPDELIEYSLLSNTNEEDLAATLEGRILALNRLQNNESTADITLRAISDGQYVDFEVHVIMIMVDGVAETQAIISVYPNPTHGQVTLAMPDADGFDYEVYNAQGQKVQSGNAPGTEAIVNLNAFPKGMYLLSIRCEGNQLKKKILVY